MNYKPQSEQTKAQHAERRQALNDKSDFFAQHNGRALLNKTIIEGFVSTKEEKRYTAAGLPVIRIMLKHLSRQAVRASVESNDTSNRRVICDISVLLIGKELCQIIEAISTDSLVKVEGFLTRNAYKDELSWVILEATGIQMLTQRDE